MALNEIQTIASELKNIWQSRDTRIQQMYTLRRLTDIYATKNYESVVVNDPKNIIRLATYLLSALPLKHRIPSLESEAEQRKNSICERALASIWREKDQEQRQQGKKPWRWQLADLMLMTGWYAVYYDLLGEKKNPEFVAEVWNPARTYPAFGKELLKVYYEYPLSAEGVAEKAKLLGWDLASYKTPSGQKPGVTVGLLWELREGVAVQSVLLDGSVVAERVATELEHIPVIVGAVGGEGNWGGYDKTDFKWAEHFGESILEPDAELFNTQNRWLTYVMQLAKTAAKPTVKHIGGEEGRITEDDLGKIVDLPMPGEDIQNMPPAQIPAEANVIVSMLQDKVQQGAFNWALFGTTGPINLSGYAIEKLLTGAYSVVGEHHAAIQEIVSDIDMTWLRKYKAGKYAPMNIVSRKPGITGLVREEFANDMVPEDPYVVVEFNIATPKNIAEKLAAARQAQPDGKPLLDPITILEDILEVDDPALIKERLAQTNVENLPEIQQLIAIGEMRKFAQNLRERPQPDNELADMIDQRWKALLQQVGAAQKPRQAPNPRVPPEAAVSPEAQGKSRALASQVFAGTPPQAGGPAVPAQGGM